jgi:hypothetical protein
MRTFTKFLQETIGVFRTFLNQSRGEGEEKVSRGGRRGWERSSLHTHHLSANQPGALKYYLDVLLCKQTSA